MSTSETPLTTAGPPLPPGPPRPPLGRYDFLFRDLRDDPWQPLGDDAEQRTAHVRERAEAMFAKPSIEGGLPAAWTFFGQFVTHDLAFDVRTDLVDTGVRVPNHRTARFDLDSVYGEGARRQPYFSPAPRFAQARDRPQRVRRAGPPRPVV